MSLKPLDISNLDRYTIMTQAEARRIGEKFYFTGRPCKAHHIALRYTTSSNCVECRTIGNTRLSAGKYPNVLWMARPFIFSASNFPDPLLWKRVEQALIDMAPSIFNAVKNQIGEPLHPREKWPEGLEWRLIENHICFHAGQHTYWPMYPAGVAADPRRNTRIRWDYEYGDGITWNGSRWMVGSEPFILNAEEMQRRSVD